MAQTLVKYSFLAKNKSRALRRYEAVLISETYEILKFYESTQACWQRESAVRFQFNPLKLGINIRKPTTGNILFFILIK